MRNFRVAAVLVLALLAPARGGELVINSNASDPAPRAAFEQLIADFRSANPDVAVRLNVYDHESYKKAIRGWLTGPAPDVVFWFAGRRMESLVRHNLLADVSALFTPEIRTALYPGPLALVTVAGRQYGVPYSYYPVGFYYRDDILRGAGLAPARTWVELKTLCAAFNRAGIVPFALGTRDLWPAAAWFDYIDLRLNGHAFHMALMAGTVPYTDRRVRAVFERWRELIDGGCFNPHHAALSWQESQALIYQGRAAMMLIGNYIVRSFPPELADNMAFAPFPQIDPAVARAEEGPTNSLHLPAKARNRQDAMRFLAFMLGRDAQEKLNAALLQLPVRRDAAVPSDRFLRDGNASLSEASALSQYFDRDTDEDLALIAMKGFQEFMLHPERLDAVLARIETARLRLRN